jgi:hypothetical protein
MSVPKSIGPEETVFRIVTREEWLTIDNENGSLFVNENAFFRRQPRPKRPTLDMHGISIFREITCHLPSELARFEYGTFGVARLLVAQIRAIGLDVVMTGETHGAINTALPGKWEDGERAGALAEFLSNISLYDPCTNLQ